MDVNTPNLRRQVIKRVVQQNSQVLMRKLSEDVSARSEPVELPIQQKKQQANAIRHSSSVSIRADNIYFKEYTTKKSTHLANDSSAANKGDNTSQHSSHNSQEQKQIEFSEKSVCKERIMKALDKGIHSQNTQYQEDKHFKKIKQVVSKEDKTEEDIDFLLQVYRGKLIQFTVVENQFGISTLRKVMKAMQLLTVEKGEFVVQDFQTIEKLFIFIGGKARMIENEEDSINEGGRRGSVSVSGNGGVSNQLKISEFQGMTLNCLKFPQKISYPNTTKNSKTNFSFHNVVQEAMANSKKEICSPLESPKKKNDGKFSDYLQQYIKQDTLKEDPSPTYSQIDSKNCSRNQSPTNKRGRGMDQTSPKRERNNIQVSDIDKSTSREEEYNNEKTPKATLRSGFFQRLSQTGIQIDGNNSLTSIQEFTSKNEKPRERKQNSLIQIISNLAKDSPSNHITEESDHFLERGDSFGELVVRNKKNKQYSKSILAEKKSDFAFIAIKDYEEIVKPLQEEQDIFKKIQFMKTIPLFSSWHPKYLQNLCFCLKEEQISKGSFLFQENDQAKDFYIVKSGEFVVSKECSTEVNDIHSLNSQSGTKISQVVQLGVSYQGEFFGEECLLNGQNAKREFSVKCSALESSVLRISKMDLDGIYLSLSWQSSSEKDEGEEQEPILNPNNKYKQLIETLEQKKKWRLDRFQEQRNRFLKEKKITEDEAMSSMVNYLRKQQTGNVLSNKHSSNCSSPNEMKLRATSSQYSARANFTSAFYNLENEKASKNKKQAQINLSSDEGEDEEDCGAYFLKQSVLKKEIQSSKSPTPQSTLRHQFDTPKSNMQESPTININQEKLSKLKTPSNHKEITTPLCSKHKLNGTKSPHKKEAIIEGNLEESEVKKELHEFKINKYQYKSDHKIILKDLPQSKIDAKKNSIKRSTELTQESQLLSKDDKSSILISKEKEDELALKEYYDLKNVPISVMFAKAQEDTSKKISSETKMIRDRLRDFGIPPTPSLHHSTNKALKQSFTEAVMGNSLNKQSIQTKLQKSRNNINNTNCISPLANMTPSTKNSSKLSLTTKQYYLQQFKDKANHASHYSQLAQNNQEYESPSKSVITPTKQVHQKQKEDSFLNNEIPLAEQEEYYQQNLIKQERQFLSAMNISAAKYRIVEMNYLESHSEKARMLESDSSKHHDMNLIQKFGAQTQLLKKKAANIVRNKTFGEIYKNKEVISPNQREGIFNKSEINQDKTLQVSKHFQNLHLAQQYFEDKSDRAGSKISNFNFEGMKSRKKIGLIKRGVEHSQNILPTNIIVHKDEHEKSCDSQEMMKGKQTTCIAGDNKQTPESIQQLSSKKFDEGCEKQTNNLEILSLKQHQSKRSLEILAQLQKTTNDSISLSKQKQTESLKDKFKYNPLLSRFSFTEYNKDKDKDKDKEADKNNQQLKQYLIKHSFSHNTEFERGNYRKSNTYLEQLVFNSTNGSILSRKSKVDNSLITNKSTPKCKPYQHINFSRNSEFCQYDSQWDINKKQLTLKRVHAYNL